MNVDYQVPQVLPYHVENNTDVFNQQGVFVATTHDPRSDVGTAREYGTAAFITKACNSHDAMLAALHAFNDAYSFISENPPHHSLRDAVMKARAAIKLVRGEA